MFLERYPQADWDGDGVLTVDERNRFMNDAFSADQGKRRAMLIQKRGDLIDRDADPRAIAKIEAMIEKIDQTETARNGGLRQPRKP